MNRFTTYLYIGFLCMVWLPMGCSQSTAQGPVHENIRVRNPEFNQKLTDLLRFDVPVVSVDSLYHHQDEYYLLDVRSPEEYKISHIQNARFINYDDPNWDPIINLPKDTPIVVYCSVGYRSEKFGNRLLQMGFTSVYNLYGSIFEWVNEGYPIVNLQQQETDKIHTYNKKWSKYIYNPDINKTW